MCVESKHLFIRLLCFNLHTPSDDMLIKLWDWDKKWQCSQVFEGHSHYVMMIVINPKDNNQFASASLDRTIKVLGTSTAVCVLFFSFLCSVRLIT